MILPNSTSSRVVSDRKPKTPAKKVEAKAIVRILVEITAYYKSKFYCENDGDTSINCYPYEALPSRNKKAH